MLYYLYIFFLIDNYLQQLIPGVNYFDELLTIFGLFLIVKYKNNRKYIDINTICSLKCYLIVVLIGVISTVLFHIQPQFSGIWRDFLAISKFPICYYAYSLYAKNLNLKILQRRVVPIAKIWIVISFVLGVLTLAFRIPCLFKEERYGLPLYNMGYIHSTYLIATIFVLIATLTSNGFSRNKWYILTGVGTIFITLRFKPLFAIIFLFLALFVRRKKKQQRLSKLKMVRWSLLLCLFTYYAAYTQIDTYLGYGEAAARGATYYYGFDLANRYFPLGSGFCTFSSSLSGVYYSPLYYYYDLDEMEGLEPDKFEYGADTFWPNIYSQYGWIGLCFYMLMLFYVFKSVHNRFKLLSDQWIAGMLLLIYSIGAAFAEAIYTNETSVIFAIALTIFIGDNYENSSVVSISSCRRRREICR